MRGIGRWVLEHRVEIGVVGFWLYMLYLCVCIMVAT